MANQSDNPLAVYESEKIEYKDGKRSKVKKSRWTFGKRLKPLISFMVLMYVFSILIEDGAQALQLFEKFVQFIWPEGVRNALPKFDWSEGLRLFLRD